MSEATPTPPACSTITPQIDSAVEPTSDAIIELHGEEQTVTVTNNLLFWIEEYESFYHCTGFDEDDEVLSFSTVISTNETQSFLVSVDTLKKDLADDSVAIRYDSLSLKEQFSRGIGHVVASLRTSFESPEKGDVPEWKER